MSSFRGHFFQVTPNNKIVNIHSSRQIVIKGVILAAIWALLRQLPVVQLGRGVVRNRLRC